MAAQGACSRRRRRSCAARSGCAERVAFQLYVVHNHDAYDPDDPRHLDLAALERELLRLKLPSQSFSFTTHRIAMADEVPLALAYAASLRHAVEPTVRADGSLDVREGAYLDSRELRAHLRGVTPPPAAATGNWRALPIFVFSVHSAEPLYVDRRYQARALEDMVIAVQSDHTSESSTFACGADAVTIDLRAAAAAPRRHRPPPRRPAAAAPLVGRRRPPRPHQLPLVGRPLALSPTAGGAAFAAHQIDAVHRNHVVGALNASAAALRDADGLLRAADAGTAERRAAPGAQAAGARRRPRVGAALGRRRQAPRSAPRRRRRPRGRRRGEAGRRAPRDFYADVLDLNREVVVLELVAISSGAAPLPPPRPSPAGRKMLLHLSVGAYSLDNAHSLTPRARRAAASA